MIPLARRYAVATAALLAMVALQVWLRGAMGATFDPCDDPARLDRLPAFGAHPSPRADMLQTGSRYSHWLEGEPPGNEPRAPLRFRFVRTFDPLEVDVEKLYYFPTLPDELGVHDVAVGSEVLRVHHREAIPVYHPFDVAAEKVRLEHYFYVRGLQPVAHPFGGGLALAWEQLLHGPQPTTVFLISGGAGPGTRTRHEERVRGWLEAAWRDYREACRS